MRPRNLALALGMAAALVAGCAADEERAVGDPVTRAEAEVLADVLQRNHQRGGADFVVTAPYGDDVLLTLTGEIDFRNSAARAVAVTSFADDRPDQRATLVFTAEDVWFGDVAGAPGWLRRPVVTDDGDGPPRLLDVVVELLMNLTARTGDDPAAFLAGDHTWEGQRSIDGRLTTLFGLQEGRRVAVVASDDLLAQFVTPLPESDVEVTVTLADHGRRRIDLPPDAGTTEAAGSADVLARLGL
ncbi:hypothetical protein E4P40_13800 [Blastococcus sp. CT_GayMR20]|uniref:hypothetical protein n=1 Tax=Blastococcus sp. CT_GayMR20 TaxID=2559609 RepID=UPI0010742A96|nr:hypothetical protein [Blastococcus sp. CT_GayMR20]TFV85789.1 hypothetical protein E4P40_13800 [Blastococcus sp. CT_GayMR20]